MQATLRQCELTLAFTCMGAQIATLNQVPGRSAICFLGCACSYKYPIMEPARNLQRRRYHEENCSSRTSQAVIQALHASCHHLLGKVAPCRRFGLMFVREVDLRPKQS